MLALAPRASCALQARALALMPNLEQGVTVSELRAFLEQVRTCPFKVFADVMPGHAHDPAPEHLLSVHASEWESG